ncbi:hypothetical protein SAMN02983003_2941 [Devosia enhydra]|uniref:Phytase-like domain-containing protein n=1 Tax=Devosia enhydra TaxID=665118 RepID=A0A1K2I0P3_9HYPH|nr:esterase-like activity of phytase family protein [Devosia enhydra]SFZ85771.1 hypothetical protein SAMN02983003_2941 [Devosia enhydra]
MKRARRPLRGLQRALLLASALSSAGPALAQAQPQPSHVPVSALPITRFQGVDPGGSVGGLLWRGGIALTSDDDRFGGLSGMGILGPDGRMVMVSDRGNFVTGQLLHDDAGRPSSVVGVDIIPMRNSAGVELPRASARDAEAMDVVIRDGVPVAIRVGFENVTRVADFRLIDGVPGGPAREVAIPAWLSRERSNETLEALCIAPPASPVAGSTLLIAEGLRDAEGNARATLLGVRDRGDLAYTAGPGTNPTDCAFLPNGDLLVLERGLALITFTMKLRRVPADQVRAGMVMAGETLLEIGGSDIDNMEGVEVFAGPGGETRIALLSDNNFNDWQRSVILTFALP